MNICRACLKTDNAGKMCKIDEKIIECFNILTDLNVKVNDCMPQEICECCLGMLNLFIKFRDKCINTNCILLDMDKSKIKDEEITSYDYLHIKIENVEQEINKGKSEILSEDNNSVYSETEDNFKYELMLNEEKCKEVNSTKFEEKKTRSSATFYSCGLCIKEFNKKSLLSKHLNEHKTNSENICDLCMQKFTDWHQLLSHRLQHLTNKNEKECHICFAKFTSSPYLEYHYKKVHSNIDNPILQCLPCNVNYTTPQQLRSHIGRCHVGKKYACDYCPQGYNCESKFKKHITEHKQSNIVDDESGNAPEKININHNSHSTKSMFQCPTCNKCYTTSTKLRKHIRRIHSEKKYICDYCSKEYSYKDQLKCHIEKHISRKVYACDECEYRSNYSTNLRFHKIRKHTTNRVYCKKCSRVYSDQLKYDAHKCQVKSVVCPTCGKTFNANKQLTRHMLSHEVMARYACDRCPSRYRTHAALRVHSDRHDGVRGYVCPHCPAAFYSSTVLNKHLRIHTGEKPYVCKICQKAFTGNNNLKVHMRVHGEYLIKKKVKNEEDEKKQN